MPQDDIYTVKRRHSAVMLQTPGVHGFGVGRDEHGADVLVVHVDPALPETAALLPREIEGYPVRVVESGPFRARDA